MLHKFSEHERRKCIVLRAARCGGRSPRTHRPCHRHHHAAWVPSHTILFLKNKIKIVGLHVSYLESNQLDQDGSKL